MKIGIMSSPAPWNPTQNQNFQWKQNFRRVEYEHLVITMSTNVQIYKDTHRKLNNPVIL